MGCGSQREDESSWAFGESGEVCALMDCFNPIGEIVKDAKGGFG
jgi:hypothetical protein